jgi:hypothetical protein
MTYQDILTIAVILSIAIFAWLFSGGGPGTPKRIRIPIAKPMGSW